MKKKPPQLTVMQFLDLLYDSPRAWYRDRWYYQAGAILTTDGKCPWVYVEDQVPGFRFTGPGVKDASVTRAQIWKAADGRPGHSKKIRRALLHACGLLSLTLTVWGCANPTTSSVTCTDYPRGSAATSECH